MVTSKLLLVKSTKPNLDGTSCDNVFDRLGCWKWVILDFLLDEVTYYTPSNEVARGIMFVLQSVRFVSASPLKPLHGILRNFVGFRILCRFTYYQEILIPLFFFEIRHFELGVETPQVNTTTFSVIAQSITQKSLKYD